MAKPGRLPREEQTLPPNIQKALAARASGSNWNEAAEVGNITPVNLRKWRKHPDAAGYLQECIQHNIEDANSYIADHAPALAARLKAWQELDPMSKLAANPPSAQAVAQARAAWGISE